MSKSRKQRRSLRPLLRLLPLFRPYLGRAALLIAATVAFASADVGRVRLVEQLLEKVLLSRGEVRGQVEDQALGTRLEGAAPQAPTLGVAQVDSARRDPLFVPEPAPLADQVTGDQAALHGLLRRTGDLLRDQADRTPPDDASGAWQSLAQGRALQQEALADYAALAPAAAQAELVPIYQGSLKARELALTASLQQRQAALWNVFLWAVGLAMVMALCQYVMLLMSRILVAAIFVDIQRQTTEHMLGLSLGFFASERRGDLLSRLTADLTLTANVLNMLAGDLLIQSILLTIYAVSAVILAPWLSLSLLVFAGAILIPIRYLGKKIRRGSKRRQPWAGKAMEALQQTLAGIRVVKSFHREQHAIDHFRYVAHRVAGYQEDTIRARVAVKTWLQLVNDLLVPALFAIGGYLVILQVSGLDAGRFAAFLGLAVLSYLPTKSLGQAYGKLNDALPAVERVFHLLDARPQLDLRPDAQPTQGPGQSVAFEDVSFAYDAGPPVLAGVSFEAKAGSMTAVVGKTGSGKSTLVDLVARFHDPVSGRVAVDGADLRDVTLESWLDGLATVPQESFLFHDTIRENIRYGRLDASDAEVEEAARQANIHDDVLGLPGGYDFVVGERGGKLSGGQVQRLAIARALLKQPRVLILDEATSALDPTTERQIQGALTAAASGTTTFVVAHRLSTVERADQILVLQDGRIVERGQHAELLKRHGVYADLLAHQLGAGEAPGPETAPTVLAKGPLADESSESEELDPNLDV